MLNYRRLSAGGNHSIPHGSLQVRKLHLQQRHARSALEASRASDRCAATTAVADPYFNDMPIKLKKVKGSIPHVHRIYCVHLNYVVSWSMNRKEPGWLIVCSADSFILPSNTIAVMPQLAPTWLCRSHVTRSSLGEVLNLSWTPKISRVQNYVTLYMQCLLHTSLLVSQMKPIWICLNMWHNYTPRWFL